MATAVASLLTGRRVQDDVGMTGEITLRGAVLPIGGVKMKVLAAHRAGLKKVILPQRNAKDLDELPQEVRDNMEFVLAERVMDVLDNALEPLPVPLANEDGAAIRGDGGYAREPHRERERQPEAAL